MQGRFKTWIKGPNPTNCKGKTDVEPRKSMQSCQFPATLTDQDKDQQPRERKAPRFLDVLFFFSDGGSE
jgi:hypothetical protein